MPEIPHYFSTSLKRNSNYVAHVRTDDYSLIFSQKNDKQDAHNLFKKHAAEIKKNQPKKVKVCNKTLTIYLVLSDQCNLQCSYCDVLGTTDHRKNSSFMTWEIANAALDALSERIQQNPNLKAQVVFFGESLDGFPE